MSNHVHYLREPAQPKPEKRNHWGSRLLAGLKIKKGKPKKTAPGQMAFPWAQWEAPNAEVQEVAEKFVFANCYNQRFASIQFSRDGYSIQNPKSKI